MSIQQTPVSVNILGKEYKIICAENEQEDLIASAQQLDNQMREIRLSGKVAGAERVAVLAALNLSVELQQSRKSSTPLNANSSKLSEHLNKMYLKIETALKKG
ncbi:MAG: cell division protein ZapA [Gammaproteobacteria bacterium]|jgi:cell division protein ZapA|nr:cell division protein ZapA [Gammaproteobacteria bacterium]MBT4147280.1 cell division protein ZapA [Gammaproteobacteria bacterium]MBT5222167.1 cell division protein ZapA [Gammaproteobacteria bacterium]MBT5826919.1 cell division protein ZapA [Gammaproteobacteria bacterium]MBT5967272.1 cell division protein ZapA [Gammaproteobacteria bacterium]